MTDSKQSQLITEQFIDANHSQHVKMELCYNDETELSKRQIIVMHLSICGYIKGFIEIKLMLALLYGDCSNQIRKSLILLHHKCIQSYDTYIQQTSQIQLLEQQKIQTNISKRYKTTLGNK